MNRLQDKVAIITGAGGGICGKAAELFCKEGAKVVMVDIDPVVEKICAGIVDDGGKAVSMVADVAIEQTWKDLLALALKQYGTVDICVNGAAKMHTLGTGDWDSLSAEELHRVFDNNIDSLLYSYHVILKYMVDNGIRGNFLNFSSSTALSYNGSGIAGYSMSKAATQISTTAMVKQVSPSTGIRFNCIAPNFVWTPNSAYLYENPDVLGWFKSVTPFPELGQPEDSAWAMVYLCSDEAKYINGVVLPTDGGWLTCN